MTTGTGCETAALLILALCLKVVQQGELVLNEIKSYYCIGKVKGFILQQAKCLSNCFQTLKVAKGLNSYAEYPLLLRFVSSDLCFS